MDPLSVSLAAFSLAATVRDLVELGKKIHKSFSNASKNLRNARRMAANIKEMVEEIMKFYQTHKDVLVTMKDFCMALRGLLHNFQTFEISILPLLPKMDGNKLGDFIRGWWNGHKIEEGISDLESDTAKVIRGYMIASAMRIEVKQEKNHQETIKGLKTVYNGVTQGLGHVLAVAERSGSSLAARNMPYRLDQGPCCEKFTRNIIEFAHSSSSTSAPMLRTPNAITEELLTSAYIKLQINGIAMSVEKMTTLPASATKYVASNGIFSFQLTLLLEYGSMGVAHLRNHVVRQLSVIRDLLEDEHIHTISIRDGASALNELSFGLGTLGMAPESIQVRTWAISLARSLFDGSGGGQSDRGADLALYLFNQSTEYHNNGDKIQSLQAIQEAYTITHNLRNRHDDSVHLRILYCDILLQYAQLVNHKRAIEMSVEAIQVLEGVFNVQAFSYSRLPDEIERVVQPDSPFFDTLFSSGAPLAAITDYAAALQRLGLYLLLDGYPETALNLVLLAIEVWRKMVAIHGQGYNPELAKALSQLVQCETADNIPTEELVIIIDECIQLLRELAKKNPLFYARELVSVLAVKACTLRSLNRDDEAVLLWEEATSLAGTILQDSKLCARTLYHLSNQFRRLKKHEDAVRTGALAIATYHEEDEYQSLRYFNLSQDLQNLRRYTESAEASQRSVALYRRLAMRDPETWVGDLGKGLSDLSYCLAALGDYSNALLSWREAVSMLDNFMIRNPDASTTVIDKYLSALGKYILISNILEDENDCLEVCSTTVESLRNMSEIYPQNTDIKTFCLWTECCYVHNMFCAGRLQNARDYIDNWFDRWSAKPEAISECEIALTHAVIVLLKADILDAQGCTEQALSTTLEAHDIVRPFILTDQPAFSKMIDSMMYEARLHVNLGNTEQALQVAERSLQLARDSDLQSMIDSQLWSLHTVALTALSCRNYKRAAEAAREGCDISAHPEWQDNEDEDNTSIHANLLALLSLAEANMGRYSTALEYAQSAVDASMTIGDGELYISTATGKHTYTEIRGILADILLANGDPAQARHISEERRAYFFKRVETRMGDYRELAPILRMLGILYCSEGRHEEGDSVAQELSKMMKSLGSAFPSLQEQVKIRLRHQAQVPILKVLEEMNKKLNCGHQKEVVSLFEI